MAREISEVQSIPFYQVIGAPLQALVQAEVQAAQASAEFIEQIGFVRSPGAGADEFGDLRMVTFRYQKPGIDGRLTDFKVQVPLLSLVSIPAVQIKDAEIEFSLQVHDIYTEKANTPVQDESSGPDHPLSPSRVGLRAGFGKRQDDHEMKLKIRIEQADVPVGLSALFRIMEQSISSQSAAPAAAA